MGQLIDAICTYRDIVAEENVARLKQITRPNGMCNRIAERITQEMRRKHADHKRELEFTWQDLAECVHDTYALLDKWREKTDPEKIIGRILQAAKENGGTVYFDDISKNEILPTVELRRDCIFGLTAFINLLSHHAAFLYMLEEMTSDDATQFTKRFVIADDGTVSVKGEQNE